MKKTYQKPEMKILPEIWKVYKDTRSDDIKNTRGAIWEVSNYGNVKKNGKEYECSVAISGYKAFIRCYLHKVVAELFIPNSGNKPQVDHIDTNKLNNCWYNLQWVTPKENNNNPLTKNHLRENRINYCKQYGGPNRNKHRVYDENGKYHYE